MTKAQTKEREEAIAQLREWIKPGDTVYTICDHVSSSGMTRHIRVLVPSVTQNGNGPHVDFLHPNHSVAVATGRRRAKRGDGIVIGGCGMDMGFALVYELSHVLYGDGYACLGAGKCPSNYHSNHRNMITCPNHCRFDREMQKRVFWHEGTEQDLDCDICVNGYVPNPEGPQRFDLIHKDGYALRHRWL